MHTSRSQDELALVRMHARGFITILMVVFLALKCRHQPLHARDAEVDALCPSLHKMYNTDHHGAHRMRTPNCVNMRDANECSRWMYDGCTEVEGEDVRVFGVSGCTQYSLVCLAGTRYHTN